MSLWSRIRVVFQAKANAALDEVEDPREMVDYGYAQQQELLRRVQQGLIEVATSKTQLEQQVKKLQVRIPQMQEQARRALAAGREDLARAALERKQFALAELGEVEQQAAVLAEQEQKLTQTVQKLSTRIEEFRGRRQVVSARYTAAQARVQVNESLSGVSGDLGELRRALERAEEKTEQLQARASAVDALLENGELGMVGGSSDPVEQELRNLATGQAVEQELAALKAEQASQNATDEPSASGNG